MPDATSYLTAAYVLTAVVLVGYGAHLLRRLARAARRAEALEPEEGVGTAPEPSEAGVSVADAPTGGPRPMPEEATRG